MNQYIDKAAVVAEIERRIEEGEEVIKQMPSSAIIGLVQAYKNILSFLDTLEVKEVDLKKEINNYIKENFFGSQTIGFFANRTEGELDDQDIALCAKHFFELGLNARKEA